MDVPYIWYLRRFFTRRNYSKRVHLRLFYTICSLANWYSFFRLTIMQIIEKKIATRASFKIVMLWLHLSFVIARNWQVWSWAQCKGKCRDTMGSIFFLKKYFHVPLLGINLSIDCFDSKLTDKWQVYDNFRPFFCKQYEHL